MSSLLVATYLAFAVILVANVAYLVRARRWMAPLPTVLPRVSVIVPARNEMENLRRLLPSLLAQRYPAFEILVYDDDSTDETWSVLTAVDDARLRPVRGTTLPPGWVGKVYALYQATRIARGDLYLFLDADVVLQDPRALERLVARYLALPTDSVLTGIPRMVGGGQLLVSLVPFMILTWLPLPLAVRLRTGVLSGMNGQCWFVGREAYHRLEPHREHRTEVLEDIRIGRYLKAHGIAPHTLDLRHELTVRMYRDLPSAWRGFRKNVYPSMGETLPRFLSAHLLYVTIFVVAPIVSPWFLAGAWGLKLATDRFVGYPLSISLGAPLSLLLGAILQIDSAVAHWRGSATWKGRRVSRREVVGRTKLTTLLDAGAEAGQD